MADKNGWENLSINLSPPALVALKHLAVDRRVSPGRLIRDILSLYLGYCVGANPAYDAERLGGPLPGIMDEPPGYVKALDFFRAPARAMPEETP